MRKRKYSDLFRKKIRKLKGQEAKNFIQKRDEILSMGNLDFYKNLKYHFKKYKRVHINGGHVILFFGDDGFVYFVDYATHDEAYKHDKKSLQKYSKLTFN